VAPITTTIRNIPSEVLLSKSEGMPRDCVINFDHTQTVSKNKIGSLIAVLSPERLEEASEAILFSLDL
jgi:mRNA interferase MazF